MAKRKKPWVNPFENNNPITGAGNTAVNAGSGGGGKGSASSGASSISSGVATATGTSPTYSPVNTATSGVSAVANAPSAPTPTFAHPDSRATTTVDLKPLISTITDPATRALAGDAIKQGLKYEINPSILLGIAGNATDYGRAGKGKGYANLGDGTEDGAASIKQAAKYLSDAGFHTDPKTALWALGKAQGQKDLPEKVRKIASGYTELDQAARKIENAPGDTTIRGMGLAKFRKPEDRPSSKAARQARERQIQGQAGDATTIPEMRGGRMPVRTGQPEPNPRQIANRLERKVKKSGVRLEGPLAKKYESLGPASGELAAAAVKYGKEFGIDPSFLMGIAEIETGFGAAAGSGTPGAGAVSSAGAQGYMQFIPESRDTVLKETGYDAYSKDPKEAMAAAAGYFSVFAPDAQSNYDRAFSYNHADWYANDVLANAEKYKDLDNVAATASQAVPKQLIQRAKSVLGTPAAKAILQGGKIVKAPAKGKTKYKLQADEVFYDGADSYYTGGEWVSGQFGDHGDHIHFASADPISMMLVVREAQKRGLLMEDAGENPAYDVIDAPAHLDANLSNHNYTQPIPDTKKANRLVKQTGAEGNVMGQAIDLGYGGDPAAFLSMREWIEKNMGDGVPIKTGPKIKGTGLMVIEPSTPSEATALTGTTGATTPAAASAALTQATEAVAKEQAKAAGRPMPAFNAPTSALGATARASLTAGTKGLAAYKTPASEEVDPILEAFRPKR